MGFTMQYRAHRYPTEFPVDLTTPLGRQKAIVANVNATGAKITKLHDGLKRGHKVQIEVLSQRIDAVVRWVNGGQAGVSFRALINQDQVDTLRYRRDRRNVVRPGAVGYAMR